MTAPVIEFVGLCGAGKSTLHVGLMPLLTQSDISFHLRQPSLVPSAVAVRTGLSCAARIMLHGGAGFLMRPAHWWLPMKLGYRRAQRDLGPTNAEGWEIEIDTGFLQPIVSFAAEYNETLAPVPVRAAATTITLPRIAVHVVSTPELALDRYLSREVDRLAHVDKRQLYAQFVQASDALDQLVTICRQEGVQVLDIRAEENRNPDAIARLAAQILNLIGEGKFDDRHG